MSEVTGAYSDFDDFLQRVRSEYTDAHRMFLQSVMGSKVCHINDLCDVYRSSLEYYKVPVPEGRCRVINGLTEFIAVINKAINPMYLNIGKGVDEISGDTYYAMMNTAPNSLRRLSSVYTTTELEIFGKVVESIVYSSNGKISLIEALNLTSQMGNHISMMNVDDALKKFSQEKYFNQKEGIFTLSVRSMIELDYYLKTNFGDDIVKCCLCQNVGLQVVTCSSCLAKAHNPCMKNFLDSIKKKRCPMCDKDWVPKASSDD